MAAGTFLKVGHWVILTLFAWVFDKQGWGGDMVMVCLKEKFVPKKPHK